MECSKNNESFENVFVTVLDIHAPRKTQILRGNQKPHIDKNPREAIIKRKNPREAIIKRLDLKSKANGIKWPKDISDYKK